MVAGPWNYVVGREIRILISKGLCCRSFSDCAGDAAQKRCSGCGFVPLREPRGLICACVCLAARSVSPKCQSARGMQGHSNKIKQEFGLTDFPKVRETIF